MEPTKILVEVKANVPKDDIFYVYYLQEGIKNWSDDNSSYLRIKGSNEIQNLHFTIPIGKKINRIRVDIGANKKQLPIKIETISFSSETGKIILTDRIDSIFKPNIYTVKDKNTYFTKEKDGRYDPFLVSDVNLGSRLDKLRFPARMIADKWVYLFSLVLTLAIILTLLYSIQPARASYFSILFLTIIVSPLFVQFAGIQFEQSNLEKRELSKWPSMGSLIEFPKKFETYYNDNFGLRPQMIALAGQIKTNIFRSSPKPELAQFGHDNFLFYNALEDEVYASYTNNNRISANDLASYYRMFRARKDSLAKKNIKYIKGFWPNKHTIYKGKLPASMTKQIVGTKSLADQIITYFNTKEEQFFDVRKPLLEQAKDKLLYRKFDTHWNSDGAYIGYKAFCEQTSSILGLTPFHKDKFNIIYKNVRSGDLTKQMGVDQIWGYNELMPKYNLKDEDFNFAVIPDSRFPPGSIVTRNPKASKNMRVLIFRDSFTTQLVQFISLHFTEVVYVNEIYNENLIDLYKPQVVISCRVERYMLTM
ncbi:hypothetical protein [uncultured Croceitalea sp.]|uniref:alginate O-acetyltransferase AlgX-related protein n=1 Tax=uncultured Croceitalea sp. TaxID=1798908 RepID=UPI00374E3888